MTFAIIEDETLAAERLQSMLAEIDVAFRVITILKSVAAATEWLGANPHPDVIISDIRLLDGLSFEIFETVRVDKPVIFTTAYDQYAIRAFEVNSVDYLLKPVQTEKLQRAIQKIKTNISEPPAANFYQQLMQLVQTQKPAYKSRFMIKLGQKIIALPVEKVAYFFSENKLSFAMTADGKKYPLDQTLDELTDVLDPAIFFRANRQFIITFPAIAEIHPYFKGRVKLNLHPSTHEEVVISSERTPEFKLWIDR